MVSRELNEALSDHYGLSKVSMVREAFDATNLSKAMQVELRDPVESECCVVFSDISGFSGRVAGHTPGEIKSFLDEYYKVALGCIYDAGGLVDQMIGDGIISVYSPHLVPDIGNVFDVGLRAAEAIVHAFANDADYSSKCALHKGRAVLCEIGAAQYRQTTIIGNLLTLVHRVEAVARSESVNMLLELPEATELYQRVSSRAGRADARWQLGTFSAYLPGVALREVAILYEKHNP